MNRTPQFETTSTEAPNNYEELIECVGSLACTAREVCIQKIGEFQDRHHLIYGEDLTEAERLLKCHPDFIIHMCRCTHQDVHRTWDRSEPLSDEFVVGYLTASPVNLTANKKRKLEQLKKKL